MQEMKLLTPDQVEQVAGGATFGYYVGAGIGLLATGGNPYAADQMGQAMSTLEDWVNGN